MRAGNVDVGGKRCRKAGFALGFLVYFLFGAVIVRACRQKEF